MESEPKSYELQLTEAAKVLTELHDEIKDDWTAAGMRIKIQQKLGQITISQKRLTP